MVSITKVKSSRRNENVPRAPKMNTKEREKVRVNPLECPLELNMGGLIKSYTYP